MVINSWSVEQPDAALPVTSEQFASLLAVKPQCCRYLVLFQVDMMPSG